MIPLFTRPKTYVLWDIEDCKIPVGLDAIAVSRNITTALVNVGFHGMIQINAFGDICQTKSDFSYAGCVMNHCPAGQRDERRNRILVDLLDSANGTPYKAKFFMLIIGDISQHMGFLRALGYLKSRGCYNVLLAQPQCVSSTQLLGNVSSACLWKTLSEGGNFIIDRMARKELRNKDKVTVFEDKYLTSNTAVFWDMEDCPIPDGLTAVVVSRNIRSALADAGFDGTVAIYAYGDMNQTQGLESAGIVPKHLPAGDRDARLDMILVDSLLWAIENRPPANLMLILGDISGHKEFHLAITLLRNRNYDWLVAQPHQNPSDLLFDKGVTQWRWASLSTGGKPFIYGRSYQLVGTVFIEGKPFSLSEIRSQVVTPPSPISLLSKKARRRQRSRARALCAAEDTVK